MRNKLEKTKIKSESEIICEFKAGLLRAIRYYKEDTKSATYNKGYDFYATLREEMYIRNGNKIYNQ